MEIKMPKKSLKMKNLINVNEIVGDQKYCLCWSILGGN